MNLYQVKSVRTGLCLGTRVLVADGIFDRMLGLMFKESLKTFSGIHFDGLILDPCNSIHTCFMKFNIDVIFLNSSNEIIRIYKNLKPWRITPIYWKAARVIEFNSGTISDHIQVGDKVDILCLS